MDSGRLNAFLGLRHFGSEYSDLIAYGLDLNGDLDIDSNRA
jgi:hypothetical protein